MLATALLGCVLAMSPSVQANEIPLQDVMAATEGKHEASTAHDTPATQIGSTAIASAMATATPEHVEEAARSQDHFSAMSSDKNAPATSERMLNEELLEPPVLAFVTMDQRLGQLGERVLIQGDEVNSQNGQTSGFRLSAGFSPDWNEVFDLGAELRYRESEDVASSHGGNRHVEDVTSFGGSLIAGLRFGSFGLYGKTGVSQWVTDPVTGANSITSSSGMARTKGIGARWLNEDWIGQVEFEESDAPELEHLNMVSASIHVPF